VVRQKQQKVVISTLKTAKEANEVRQKRQKLLVSTLKMTKLPNYEIKVEGYFVFIS